MAAPGHDPVNRLAALIRERSPVVVLSGAGCSTSSGIPDYRDRDGRWKQRPPMQYREFMASEAARRRYWGRSMVGWKRFAMARPSTPHRRLAELEAAGTVSTLITQNVDGPHQAAGHRRVIDLHGRLDHVVCTACRATLSRAVFQRRLEVDNAAFLDALAGADRAAPSVADGDVALEADYAPVRVPACRRCAGVLKPDVVFFGETVPRERVAAAFDAVASARLLLVVGSSLMVYSGYRFCRHAGERGIPVAVVGLGNTRADPDAVLKVEGDCGAVLDTLAAALVPQNRVSAKQRIAAAAP